MKETKPKLAKNTSVAARYLGISEGMLRKLRGLDEGPPVVRIGTRAMYLFSDLDSWIEQQREFPAGVTR